MFTYRWKNHNESVYQMVPLPTLRKPRYMSQFNGTVKREVVTNKKKHRTMGLAETPRNDPRCFLKKSKNPRLCYQYFKNPTRSYAGKSVSCSRLCMTLKAEAQKAKNLQNNKLTNLQYAYKQKGMRSCSEHNICNQRQSGKKKRPKAKTDCRNRCKEMPLVLNKDFGQVPKYLPRTERHEMGDAECSEKSFLKKTEGYLTRTERECIMQGLKNVWNDTFEQYQGMSLERPTNELLIKKREGLEDQLKQLELDIRIFESDRDVFIDKHAKKSRYA